VATISKAGGISGQINNRNEYSKEKIALRVVPNIVFGVGLGWLFLA
jgi:hypothetical protein